MPDKKPFPVDLQDAFCFGGLAVLGVGLWFWDFRISLGVIGVLLMVIGRGVIVIKEKREGKR